MRHHIQIPIAPRAKYLSRGTEPEKLPAKKRVVLNWPDARQISVDGIYLQVSGIREKVTIALWKEGGQIVRINLKEGEKTTATIGESTLELKLEEVIRSERRTGAAILLVQTNAKV